MPNKMITIPLTLPTRYRKKLSEIAKTSGERSTILRGVLMQFLDGELVPRTATADPPSDRHRHGASRGSGCGAGLQEPSHGL